MPDSEISEVDGKINDIGKLEAHVHYNLSAATKNFSSAPSSAESPNPQWQRVVENVNSGMGGDVTDLKISDPARHSRALHHVLPDVSKPNFLDWSKKKVQPRSPLCQFNLADIRAYDDDRDADSEPLKLGPKADYVYQSSLELPAKYTARAHWPFSLKRDYAEYQAHLQAGRNHLHCRPHATLRQDELPAPARGLRSLPPAPSVPTSASFFPSKTPSPVPPLPRDMKADDLVERRTPPP